MIYIDLFSILTYKWFGPKALRALNEVKELTPNRTKRGCTKQGHTVCLKEVDDSVIKIMV